MRSRIDRGGRGSGNRAPARRLAGLALGAALASAGCALGSGSSSAPSGDRTRERSGEALFRRHCAPCHGIRARGDGPVANLLREQPADLTRIAARRDGAFPEPAILRVLDGRDPVLAHGPRERPVWGERFGEGRSGEAAEEPALRLLEYLKSVQRPAGDPREALP